MRLRFRAIAVRRNEAMTQVSVVIIINGRETLRNLPYNVSGYDV